MACGSGSRRNEAFATITAGGKFRKFVVFQRPIRHIRLELAIKLALRFDGTERDQQKWIPVLRPIAL
jgi:hypothetical protein